LEIALAKSYNQPQNQQDFYEGLVHEVGHVFYYTEFTSSTQKSWDLAMKKDHFQPDAYPGNSTSNGVSKYAEFSSYTELNTPNIERKPDDKREEDVGETFALYILSIQNSTPENNLHAQVRAAFPERFAILDQFADKLLTPAQIQQYLPTPK
jgi:hypothetical protein